eukprot:scaffold121592_cov18-Tisochrysis_lutea.AAC.3
MSSHLECPCCWYWEVQRPELKRRSSRRDPLARGARCWAVNGVGRGQEGLSPEVEGVLLMGALPSAEGHVKTQVMTFTGLLLWRLLFSWLYWGGSRGTVGGSRDALGRLAFIGVNNSRKGVQRDVSEVSAGLAAKELSHKNDVFKGCGMIACTKERNLKAVSEKTSEELGFRGLRQLKIQLLQIPTPFPTSKQQASCHKMSLHDNCHAVDN